ncbi:hypothetical protein HYW61_00705 [candidate division WWE3 bacterium]|nr:hypothetical protein [candidate division WWE3 bacterium]
MKTDATKLASFLLRVGLAVAFLYAAVGSFLEPGSWVGYFPSFLKRVVPEKILLDGFFLYQVGLSLWLLSGKHIVKAGLAAAITLALIIISNFNLLDILFRDVAIFVSALALISLHIKAD